MNDYQPPSQEPYTADEPDDETAAPHADALWLLTPAPSNENGVFGRQDGNRNGTPNGVSTFALDLRPEDLADDGARSPWSVEESYGPVVSEPSQEDGAANVSPLAESIVEAIDVALVVLDAGLHVRQANPAFYDLFKVGPQETEHHDFCELGGGQ
jgi:PAS domain-containing protein